MKRSLQTALVWTLYEELMPRITALGKYVGTMTQDPKDPVSKA